MSRTRYTMPPPDRIALSLNEVCALCGLGMTSIRKAIDTGALRAARLGKKIIVRRDDVETFLKNLPATGPKNL
jgi:excisionase family DNA binding protein